jgi:hypothetical protein
MVRSIKGFFVLVLILLAALCMPGFGQTSANDWFDKGIALYNQGKYDQAIQAYDKAIEINPQYAEAWNNKGIALNTQGNYDDGIKAHDKARKLGYTGYLPPSDELAGPIFSDQWDPLIEKFLVNVSNVSYEEIPTDYYYRNITFVNRVLKHYKIENNPDGLAKFLLCFLTDSGGQYDIDHFDCSEMAAYTERKLELFGFDAKVCCSRNFILSGGGGHAWVSVDLPQGRYYIEATRLQYINMPRFEYTEKYADTTLTPEDPRLNGTIITPSQQEYTYYSNYDKISDDIYDLCNDWSIEEFNWWKNVVNYLIEDVFKDFLGPPHESMYNLLPIP